MPTDKRRTQLVVAKITQRQVALLAQKCDLTQTEVLEKLVEDAYNNVFPTPLPVRERVETKRKDV